MMKKLLLTLLILIEIQEILGVKFTIVNNCGGPIWPGIQGSTIPEGGGFKLEKGESRDIYLPDRWQAGRIWARTWCDNNMNCGTGFCGNNVQCNGAGGRPPATLAEFTLGGAGNQDYYDVSLVDGYNVDVLIEPIQGTFQSNGGQYDCKSMGRCHRDMNSVCPNELKLWYNGVAIGCYSACTKFNTDQYCCRGAYGTPETCKSSNWPVNYPSVFKNNCPDDYSYAYDDHKSTYTCRGSGGRISPDYKITFSQQW